MRLLGTVFVLVLSAWSLAGAKTIDLAGENASLDLPDSWIAKPQPADSYQTASVLILSAVSDAKTSMLQLQVCNNPQGILASQPAFITNIKEQITNLVASHAGQVQFTSESSIKLNDVPAYLIQFTETTTSKPVLARSYEIAANGRLYIMTLRTIDPAADADLLAIANSFRFATPPQLPVPHVPEHRIRYYLMAGAGVLLLVGLGIGFYYYRQRQIYE